MAWLPPSASPASSVAVSERSDAAGRHSATVRRPAGEASQSTTSTSRSPISAPPKTAALGAVADDSATVGAAP